MVDANLVIAAALLIGAFVIAIKVLKTLFEAATIAAISAAFYAVMAVSFDYPLGIDTVLAFSALGTVLYVGYSILIPLLGMGWSVLKLPFEAFSYFSSGFEKLRRSRRLSKIENTLKKHDEKLEDEEDDSSSTKEVVLDKVAGKDSSSQE